MARAREKLLGELQNVGSQSIEKERQANCGGESAASAASSANKSCHRRNPTRVGGLRMRPRRVCYRYSLQMKKIVTR